MRCEQVQQRLPEYWAGIIAVNDHREIDRHLEECPDCRAEATQLGRLWKDLDRIPAPPPPSPQLRTRFYEMLDAYRSGVDEKPKATKPFFAWLASPWPAFAAACAMLVVGVAAGRYMFPATVTPTPKAAEDPQIAQLRTEVNHMRQMVALSLLQQQSASERMRGVTFANRVDKSDREVVSALLDTVKSDPSVNVRLAAVDAFRNFSANTAARRSLIETVRGQDSPLVQIAIIELLVDLNDQTAVKTLNTFSQDTALPVEVQQRARWAVTQLH